MRNAKKQLPTMETFKSKASLLKEKENITLSESLDQTALSYGFKSYNAIKPFFVKSIFPINPDDILKHLDRHILNSSIKNAGYPDFFMNKAYRLYDTTLTCFFELHPYAGKEIRTFEDLYNLESIIKPKTLFPILRDARRKNIPSLKKLEELLFEYLGERKNKIIKISTKSPEEVSTIQNIKTIGKCGKYEDMWSEDGFNEGVDAWHLNDSIQQFGYPVQVLYFFFRQLEKGYLDDAYYERLFKDQPAMISERQKEDDEYIESFKTLFHTAFIHEDLDSFVDDVRKNKPIDQRVSFQGLLLEESLMTIFLKRTEIVIPFKDLERDRSYEAIIKFKYILNDLLHDIFKEEMEEAENKEK